MYIYNILVYGHDLSIDPDLCNQIAEMDFEFEPGGHNATKPRLVLGCLDDAEITPIICGTQVASSECKNFLQKCRTAIALDYSSDYDSFVEKLIEGVEKFEPFWRDQQPDVPLFAQNLTAFLRSNKPDFYLVQLSS